jgi:hypothetical protein
METKQQQNRHGEVIYFSTINPLESWKKMGLQQLVEPILLDPTDFKNDESKRAYEAFKKDFLGEKKVSRDLISIDSDKGSIFIWSLLKEISERSPRPKLSSKKFLFKDDLFKRICEKVNELLPNLEFSKKDFEDIMIYLENKNLVTTSSDGIRTTQHFASWFHVRYEKWLVFG